MGRKVKKSEAKAFRELIERFCLREFELANASFTHKRTRGTWSRIDRFFVTPGWSEIFGEHRERGIPR